MKPDFAFHYANYKPCAAILEQLKIWKRDTKVIIVLGTWCGDSRLQMSHFYKILDDAGIDDQWVKLICVDESKREENGLTDPLNITRVPTFIFSKEGVESGRITESPELSLEEDMLNLFKKTNLCQQH